MRRRCTGGWLPRLGLLIGGALAALLVVVGPVAAAPAGFGDTTADAVLGQPDYSQEICNRGLSAKSVGGEPIDARALCVPQDLAVGLDGRLYVADFGNDRVLSWPSALSFTSDQPADLVLGEVDFTRRIGSCDQLAPDPVRLCGGSHVAVDPLTNRVYVIDDFKQRIVAFDAPHTNGQPASLVLGQPDATSTTSSCQTFAPAPASASTLCAPSGMAVDALGNLWVADSGNGRVLRFHSPHVTGQAADMVLGQPNFISRPFNANPRGAPCGLQLPNAADLCFPTGVAVDLGGQTLYVADGAYRRVLRYGPMVLARNGQAANLVLGAPDFTTVDGQQAVTAQSVGFPQGLALDRAGNLYVADTDRSRVLRFSHPRQNNQPADVVFGQPDFSQGRCNRSPVLHVPASADSLCGARGVATDARGDLLVADTQNSRVLRFDQPGVHPIIN